MGAENLGAISQLGYVVRDVEAAMRYWVDTLRVGPWFYFEQVDIEDFQYRGRPSDVAASIALANSGPLQVELIQQRNDAPSMYKEFLDRGLEGLQHVAYFTEDYDAALDGLLGRGYEVGQSGCIGGASGRFVYFAAEQHPGSVLELVDTSAQLGQLFDFIRAAAADWDGSDPIRRME